MHSTSMGVDIFFSLMRSYFCLLVAAFRPCHGSEPRLKYMRTYPNDSRSSRLDCSVETTSGNKDDEEETGFTTEYLRRDKEEQECVADDKQARYRSQDEC